MQRVKLKEIGKVITGCTPSTKQSDYYIDDKYMFVGPSDIKNVMYVMNSEKKISEKAYEDYKNRFIDANSIVVDCIGSDMGNVAIVTERCLTNQQINAITNIDESKYNIKYIYYILSTMKKYFHLIGTNGSTMPILNKSMFENVEIEVPNINIQNRVAEILSKFDDKILLNKLINENLHNCCINYFSMIFDEYEYEDILNNLCSEITRGYTKGYTDKSSIFNLNQKVNKGEILEKQYYKFLDEKQTIPSNRYARENDILLNSLGQGTLGRVHLFGENVDNVVVDQHLTILRTNNKINPYYLYYLLITPEFQNKIESSVTGTTGMLMLNISTVRGLKIPVPSEEKLNKFKKIAEPIRKIITNNYIESERLSELRNILLPMLISGEIELNEY